MAEQSPSPSLRASRPASPRSDTASAAADSGNGLAEDWSWEKELRFLAAAGDGDIELLTRIRSTYPDELSATHPETWSTLHKALARACSHGRLDVVKWLLNLWLDEEIVAFVNLRDPRGLKSAPLHDAVDFGASDVIKYLIEAGADPMLGNLFGYTALHDACRQRDLQTMRTIIESSSAHDNHDANYINALINAQDGVGNTYLHLAVQLDDAPMLAYLLEMGARLDIGDCSGATAWETAASNETCAYSTSVFALKEATSIVQQLRNFVLVRRLLSDGWDYSSLGMGDTNIMHAQSTKRYWVHIPTNKKTWVLASLQDISRKCKLKAGEYFLGRALGFVGRHFLQDYEVNEFLRVREPSCMWEYLGSYDLKPENASHLGLNGVQRTWRFSDSREDFEASFGEYDMSEEETWLHGPQHCMSLVMPYFYPDSLKSVAGRLTEYNGLTEKSEICNSDRRELHGVHLRLTLDEYCNPTLPHGSLEKRNKDQVLVREAFRIRSNEQDPDPGADQKSHGKCRILIVNQLWLWKLGEIVVISLPEEVVEKVILVQSSTYGADLVEDQNLRIANFLLRLINSLNRPAQAGLSEPPLNTYANEIDAILESVQQYAQGEGVDDLQIQKEKQFFHEIGDVRDELSMIKSVILQQEEVWREFSYSVWPECWPDGQDGRFRAPSDSKDENLKENWRVVARPLQLIQKYKRKIDRLDEEAARVEASITRLLDLKSKHATIKETHSMAVMSAAIFGFTIVTIIFTPLTFVTSLFALHIEGFQNAGVRYTRGYIGKWAATTEIVSVAFTVLLMWAAVRFGMGVHLFSREGRFKEQLKELRESKKSSNDLEGRETGSDSNTSEEKQTTKDQPRKRSVPREPGDNMV